MPKLSGHQLHCSNPPLSTAEDYYRISIYNKFLSHIVTELEVRFVNNPSQGIVTGLLNLLPSECVQVEQDVGIPDDLASAVELFKGDLPHDVMFSTEYYSWVQEWKECSTTIPDTLVSALENCSSLSYPNLAALLKIALTLPITSCESERSFKLI